MGFLKGRRRGGATEFERALRLGLRELDRADETVRWILTGEGPAVNLGVTTTRSSSWFTADDHGQIMDLVAREDPAVEWRIGMWLCSRMYGAQGPTAPLEALWQARNRTWPDDERIFKLLDAGGVSRGDYLESLVDIPRWGGGGGKGALRDRPSFDGLVRDHPDLIKAQLGAEPDRIETVAGALIPASAETLSVHAELIVALATDSSKKRRSAGIKLADHVGYGLLAPHLQRSAVDGGAPTRAASVGLLARLAGDKHHDEVVAFCDENCAADRSSAVRDAVEALSTLSGPAAPELNVALPDLDHTPPNQAARAAYDKMFDLLYEAETARYEWAQAMLKQHPGRAVRWAQRSQPAQRVAKTQVEAGWQYITDGGAVPVGLFDAHAPIQHARAVVADFSVLHGFRLLRLVGDQMRWGVPFKSLMAGYRQTGHPTPLEMQAAAEDAGFDRRDFLRAVPTKLPWTTDDIWPWAAALLPEILAIIAAGDTDYWDKIDKYYAAVATLPSRPPELRRLLLTQAVSGRKSHRPLAKAAMAGDEGVVASVAVYLDSRKYDERAEAAYWLADLEATEAAKALHKAAKKEKHDFAKGALLTALERIGEPIDRYLDRDGLLEESAKGLAKKLPAGAAWIPLDSLPALRWRDGTAVDPQIIKWFVIQAIRLKSPAPSPIVYRYLEQMHVDDVERFAEAVLHMWLAEDLRSITTEEATAEAKQRIPQVRQWPDHYPDLQAMTDDQLVAHFLPQYLGRPAGSATTSKGILSLVGAGGGLGVVAPSEAYIRKWFGMRSSQCKALVEMLAWIDEPAAIQLVLSIGSRFRTKGIQKEALLQAELLAERKGWTLEDLAYRTVPTGGFDTEGSLALVYGDREFTARLADDLTIVLTSPDGKQIKALPAARKDEDPEQIKLAKKDLSGAKKQIKAVAKEQPLRLHEAMGVQRHFDVDDFERYVLQHPVMSRLATRLVWATVDPEPVLFRPLSDSTLLDVHDDDVTLSSGGAVRLAHSATDGEHGDAWSQHFADYQVARLFPQFSRPAMPTLVPGQETLTSCRGAIIDDRRLRSVVNKLGYELGPGEDGGAVSVIKRRFPSARIEARVAVRGLHAAIMQADVALEDLSFGPLDENETMALSEVPPALLVETIADVEQIVAAGEGIVDDWEKRVAW